MIKELRSRIDQEKGKRDEVKRNLAEWDSSRKELKKSVRRSEEAQAIIQKVAQDTQSQLEIHISDIVTMALETIFDDPYTFKIEFVVKRNKTECELIFEKDDVKIHPLSASGGGVIDVASFALRIALWTLQTPRSRNTIIMDESFKFLSKDLLPRMGELLQELKKRLNLQFILVTHLKELEDCADKVFEVVIKDGVSRII